MRLQWLQTGPCRQQGESVCVYWNNHQHLSQLQAFWYRVFQTLLILNGRLDATNNRKYMKFHIIITKYLINVMLKACFKILMIDRSNMQLKKKIPLLSNRSVQKYTIRSSSTPQCVHYLRLSPRPLTDQDTHVNDMYLEWWMKMEFEIRLKFSWNAVNRNTESSDHPNMMMPVCQYWDSLDKGRTGVSWPYNLFNRKTPYLERRYLWWDRERVDCLGQFISHSFRWILVILLPVFFTVAHWHHDNRMLGAWTVTWPLRIRKKYCWRMEVSTKWKIVF